MSLDDINQGVELNPDDYDLTVVKYKTRGPDRGRLGDKALERVGDEDAWSKSTLRKVAVVSRWRRFKDFLKAIARACSLTKSEPKPPFSD